ncbi:16S rRNA (cytosine(967)-C(5))-methyltransferase RsmB [Microbulbifer flavimaris]|uniref:16S rRNA (cytosine(967)-C(5))-methyltransferase n=1 Tax=Microbulbifer flavimaris TaxID=1781068 RepID=A0ABX4I074_9GAMM|nr:MULTISPECIES: 16S rRNA (cytosine(967)-C(5))-methyltransferase RsmB [Microbulbifer]KUJ83080.1 16S rRNA methyltransferase [Microbulbifer sp. ZGT114]PCO05357.1 16S rRNA (cytosine(967)-C(5))-methyltransferase RsmB [Microbulbifer flavimaris]
MNDQSRTDVRAAAARVLAELLQSRGSLARLLPAAERSVSERDRPLLRELCYGSARTAPRLQLLADKLLRKPPADIEVRALILLGLYQLEFTRIPDHASISATVNAARSLGLDRATGVINGVLRNALRNQETLQRKLSGNPQFSSMHPAWLQQAIKGAWGAGAAGIFRANNTNPPMTLRVNTRHQSRDDYLAVLQQAGIDAAACEISPVGITLDSPCPVESLPGFAEGQISVQDESAQLAALLLAPGEGERVLDACAAPGGKTAHLLEQAPGIHLSALDIDEERLDRVIENLDRGEFEAELICADAGETEAWWDGKPFDRILLDAPCSATGVIRRNPDIKLLRRAEDITALAELQARLLRAQWQLLKPGGTLLYATCSILPTENTEVVARFIADTPDARDNTPQLLCGREWGVAQPAGRQLFPRPEAGDGFYYALLQKS